MKRMAGNLRKVIAILPLLILNISPLTLASAPLFAGGVSPLMDTTAYKQFKLRPVSEYSKLVYLIDRFSVMDIEIVYDGHYYKAPYAARVARWFLARNYKKDETVKDWILRWCSSSVPAGNLIYVKYVDGKFRLGREILTEELKTLNETIKADDFFQSRSQHINELAQKVTSGNSSSTDTGFKTNNPKPHLAS